MKKGIHPTYYDDAIVICGTCGNTFRTGSTKKEIRVDVCSNCHPFYTGEQRIVDTAGQVERFMKRQAAKELAKPEETKPKKKRVVELEPEPEAAPAGPKLNRAERRKLAAAEKAKAAEAQAQAAAEAPAEAAAQAPAG